MIIDYFRLNMSEYQFLDELIKVSANITKIIVIK